ncbi:hypothetical protein TNCT_102811 [Trichonephila clavata]|uniref:Uncharacterized protein n=1 Tax=Trichonephila clavata TaxID=2740835 RepID=A0A8X6L318_TRICU|nr:hypothetical protein TNCT_102811 [Trichonephila clavata]
MGEKWISRRFKIQEREKTSNKTFLAVYGIRMGPSFRGHLDSLERRLVNVSKAVTPKCLGGPPVDCDRLNDLYG